MIAASVKTIRWGWFLVALVPVLICSVPLLFIVFSSAQIETDALRESSQFFSYGSVWNTFLVCFGVLLVSCILGVGSAYAFSTYSFFGSRLLETAFLLPIAIPGYIMAITWSSFFDYGGLFYQYTGTYMNIMNMGGLILVLSSCLYPYVFISSLHAFKLSSVNYTETANLLGIGGWRQFRRIALPLALPAIIAGAWLVFMETLNDFGAASYFGIRTISTEIYRCWNISPSITIFLSLCVLFFIAGVMILINYLLSKKRFNQPSKSRIGQKIKLKGYKGTLLSFILFTVFLLTFVLPVMILAIYALRTGFGDDDVFVLMVRSMNSFTIAAWAAFFILLLCVITSYSNLVQGNKKMRLLGFLSDFGYAVPGTVLAVALISVSTFFDNTFNTLITGTMLFLIGGYVIRFYTVARQPVDQVYNKLPQNLFNASVTMGKKPLVTFLRVYLPVLLPAFISIFLLVFIDVLKELPLTLILRPFNFNTLSTSVYGYAKVNESVGQAAPYSLLIITLGVLAVLLLRRIEKRYGITQG